MDDLIKFKDIGDIYGDVHHMKIEYDTIHINNTLFDFNKVINSRIKDHIISKVQDYLMLESQQIYTIDKFEYNSSLYHIDSKYILTDYSILQKSQNPLASVERCDITGFEIINGIIPNKRLLIGHMIKNSKIFFDDIYIGYETKTIEECDKFYIVVNFKYKITNLSKITLVEKDDDNYGYYLKQKRKELLNEII